MVNQHNLDFSRSWEWAPFLGGFAISGIILGSWFFPGTRLFLDALDEKVFFLLNGILASNPSQQAFWGIINNSLFDLVPGALLLMLFYLYLVGDNRKHLAVRSRQLLYFLLLTPILLLAVKQIISIDRLSPSLVLKPVIRLSELVPWTHPKDASGHSFPGDHATVLFICTAYLWIRGGRRIGIAALLISLLFVIPRLVGGAHWATDVLVGGVSASAMIVSILLFSPLEYWLDQKLDLLRRKLF